MLSRRSLTVSTHESRRSPSTEGLHTRWWGIHEDGKLSDATTRDAGLLLQPGRLQEGRLDRTDAKTWKDVEAAAAASRPGRQVGVFHGCPVDDGREHARHHDRPSPPTQRIDGPTLSCSTTASSGQAHRPARRLAETTLLDGGRAGRPTKFSTATARYSSLRAHRGFTRGSNSSGAPGAPNWARPQRDLDHRRRHPLGAPGQAGRRVPRGAKYLEYWRSRSR